MKKMLSVLIAVIMVLSFMSLTIFAKGPEITTVRGYGDVDGNGVIDTRDYILIKLAAMGQKELTDEEFAAADIDGNGIIEDTDAEKIKNDICGITPIVNLYKPGDVNGDGEITVMDYISLKLHLLGIQELIGREYEGADINGNGRVDTIDYIMIKLHLLGVEEIIW